MKHRRQRVADQLRRSVLASLEAELPVGRKRPQEHRLPKVIEGDRAGPSAALLHLLSLCWLDSVRHSNRPPWSLASWTDPQPRSFDLERDDIVDIGRRGGEREPVELQEGTPERDEPPV